MFEAKPPELNGKVPNRRPSRNIYLFVPNIIGYIRIVLLGIACHLLYLDWYLEGSFMYIVFIVLDYVDGYYARKLNQCTVFGGLFDAMIDLLGETLMSMHIAVRYPSYINLIQFHIFFALGCEWLSTSAHGSCGSMNVKTSTTALLKFYYDKIMDYSWFGYNAFLALVNISSYNMGPIVPLFSIHLVPLLLFILFFSVLTRFLFNLIRIYESLKLYEGIETRRQLEKFT
ncbi:CDP-diacylglycerol--inositol 3-phosphatidyltransferase-like [Anneissia japonica]|uniref:CDP-diacylglycerol--inositol 3-phosphatidyltransferase-like n=1 Tax=Anneissia japonica TaxID=1529436 RepID=UPI001425941E|nr:CDP-diacylglycerol--inositol 3-phosphatidyltransferase-like [Anneissia japonica]